MNLEKFPALIAITTFIAICLVVSHEWAYFGVIGPELQSLFTTYDYFSVLILWLGPAFITLLAILGIYIALLRSDDFEVKKIATSRWGRFIENWKDEIFWSVLACIALLFSSEVNRLPLFMLGGFLWTRLSFYILSYESFASFRTKPAGVIFAGLPAIMILFYGIGRDEAYTDLIRSKNIYELRHKDQYVSREVRLVRLIEKGAIFVDLQSKSINFMRREDIMFIRKSIPDWETRSFVCKKWEFGCGVTK